MGMASSLLRYVEYFISKAPEYLDLGTAQTDAEFAAAFETILERALDELESGKKHYHNMCEDGLTQILKGILTRPGVNVIREGYSNGHVDLTIQGEHCSPIKKILAEAKIHGGPQYHIDGMAQLLERYLTGRETRGVIISYFKNENIKGLTENIMERLDDVRPLKQVDKCKSHPHGFKWMFLSTHKHSSGEEIVISHAGCNLFYEGS
jgi:hypothetical protein